MLPLYAKESNKFAEIEAATDITTVEAIGW